MDGPLKIALGGEWTSTDPEYVEVMCALADAYLADGGYVWPEGTSAELRLAQHRMADGHYHWGP